MYKKHVVGKNGEDIATEYLLNNNYEIIERNFNCKQGEIDVIAKDKDELVFIEVKTRTYMAYGSPVDAITYYKQKHILKTVEYYLYVKKLENEFVRIDVIEVYKKNSTYCINHIKGAIEK